MTDRIIAVGDIHGCASALDALLDRIEPRDSDTIVMLGDYVDRGPDSVAVIERLMKLEHESTVIPLIGNHEVMMLTALDHPAELHFWLQCGGQSTVDSYGGELSEIPFSHLDFLRSCRLYYETEAFFFVHANYVADLPLDKQPHQTLLWDHLTNNVPPPHRSGKTAVVGHTPQPNGEILNLEHILCIDTHCYGNGWLTAIDLVSGHLWQADKKGNLRNE